MVFVPSATEAEPTVATYEIRHHYNVPTEFYQLWLDPTLTIPEAALNCLRPYPDDALVAYPVSAAVSNPRDDAAHLIAPLG